jgi:DNA-binding MarR family transcriptional regulator
MQAYSFRQSPVENEDMDEILDRLEEFELTRRKPDPRGRRSILIQRTATGMKFLRELRQFCITQPQRPVFLSLLSGAVRLPAI